MYCICYIVQSVLFVYLAHLRQKAMTPICEATMKELNADLRRAINRGRSRAR